MEWDFVDIPSADPLIPTLMADGEYREQSLFFNHKESSWVPPSDWRYGAPINGYPKVVEGAFPIAFSLPVWSHLEPVLGAHVESYPLVVTDHVREVDLVAVRAKRLLREALDLDRSEFTTFASSGRIHRIKSFVFKDGEVKDPMVFQCMQKPRYLMVTKSIADEIMIVSKAAGCDTHIAVRDAAVPPPHAPSW